MQKQIKFIKTGCCSAIGNFENGDTARLHRDFAAHLVEIGVAEHVDVKKKEPEPIGEFSAKKRKKR